MGKTKQKRDLWFIQWLVCLALVAVTGVLLVQLQDWKKVEDITPPQLTYSSVVPEYTPGEDVSDLLEDVEAVDEEDGDVTSSVRIRTISLAEDGSKAIVTYVAKDQKNNIGMIKRSVDLVIPKPKAKTEDVQ